MRQRYGGSQQDMGQKSKHTQWLSTGSGMLHEEMFDNSSGGDFIKPVRQELYQLWLNVPAKHKWTEPSSVLLGGPEETPLVVTDSSRTLVLAGSFEGHSAAAPTVSRVSLLHVQILPGGEWIFRDIHFETVILYVRKGSGLQCMSKDAQGDPIPVHHIAYMDGTGRDLVLQNSHDTEVADFFLMAGEPLREPCVASGSMVMNNAQEINQAYADYQNGLFGTPWDHNLSDDDWKKHIKETTRF